MSGLNILIVGASIAGPTAAYWLARAGAKVTVIERFPHLRTNGQAVDIRTVGVAVMRKMPGLEEAVRAKRPPIEGMSFVRADGRPYGILRPSGDPDQQALISEYEIFRGDLGQILYDMTKDDENIRYVFGEQIGSMRQSEKGDGAVTVEFMNGYPTSEYDLVVACDGATSRTRAMALGCGVRDHMRPISSFLAYCTLPNSDLLDGSGIGVGHSAVRGRTVCLGGDLSGGNRAMFMGVEPRNDNNNTVMRSFREAVKAGDEATKRFIAGHFGDMGWKTPQILKGMLASADFYASEVVQVHCPALSRRRLVLVGDAGYAPGPTGTGTTLAMAGAYVLAGEVTKRSDDLAAALRGYEEVMRPLIVDMQKIPPLVPGVFAPYTAWGLWLRNAVFAVVCGSGVSGFVQKYFGSAFAEAERYPLPEYDWKS